MQFRQVSKETLMAFWNNALKKTGLKIRYRKRIQAIERQGAGFVVKSTGGTHRARAVLLAIGRRGTPRKLDLPGEEQSNVVYA